MARQTAWSFVVFGWQRPVRASTVEVLRAHLDQFGERSPDALVFTTVQGRMLHPNNLNERVWKPTVEAAEISVRPRIHDLRHMHASWLISRGVDLLIVQRRLGHESIVTTADRYGHLIPGAQDAATNALDRLLAEDDDTESPAA